MELYIGKLLYCSNSRSLGMSDDQVRFGPHASATSIYESYYGQFPCLGHEEYSHAPKKKGPYYFCLFLEINIEALQFQRRNVLEKRFSVLRQMFGSIFCS